MLPKVYDAIRDWPAALALVGDRIYRHGSAPQGVTGDRVTWSVPAGDAELVLDTIPDADQFRVQVDCWSQTDAGVEVLASAVRDALAQVAVLVAYVADERDTQTQTFRMSFQYDWILSR